MANKKKAQLTTSPEWAKHLRKIGKRFFWKGERSAQRKLVGEEVLENKSTSKLSDISIKLSVIENKISELKALDKEFSVFGSEHHKYQFDSSTTLEEVIEFEKVHDFTLPDDYREFILKFGIGGCGPCYGLLSLQKGVLDLPQNIKQSDVIELSKPFRFETIWNIKDIEGDAQFQEDEYDESKWCDGMLRICHEGCGSFINIVVTGKEKGNLWIDGRVSEAGIFPLNYYNGEGKTSFTQWYIKWLDDSIDKF